MQINTISLVIYTALIVLSAYNLRLAWRLSKLQTSALLRRPEDILPDESARLQAIDQDKKKWNILGRIFFWVALLVAFVGEMEELAFFLSLYSICNIMTIMLHHITQLYHSSIIFNFFVKSIINFF